MEPVLVSVTVDCTHNGTRPELSETDCAIQTNASVSLQHQLHSGFLGVFLGSVSLLTVFMNILVLYAVRKERMLHTVGNLYIVSLSVADLIVGATVMPLNLSYLLWDEWRLGRAVCQFWLVMDYVASTASIFSLFILCLDRYRSVRHPLRYLKYRTRCRATLLICGAWLLSLMWVVPILGWRSFAQVDRKPESENKCDTDFRFVTWFKVLTAILNFYVPSVLMLWFYSRIFCAVREHFRQWESVFSQLDSSKKNGVGHKGVHEASPRGSLDLSAHVHTEGLLDQYSLEQQGEIKEPHAVKTLKKPFHKKGSFFNVSAKSMKKSVEDIEDSFCSIEDEDFESETPSRVSVLPMNFLQSAEDGDDDPKMIVSVNICNDTVTNSVADAHELASSSDVHQLAHAMGCNNHSQPFRESWSEDLSQKLDTSKTVALKQKNKKTWQKFRDQSKHCVQKLRIHKERKAAQQLGFIITGFMVCWIPYFITYMVMAICSTCVHHDLHMFAIWLGYINSTLNPFIYPMCNANFKRVFKRIFHIAT
ncbi:histamine H1 receptor [Clupea harengus]|uniref:Histamine H1 receptor n=1 Tax=Clupea harengus TaxID=7950 RepID=A0A6P3W4I4_CLUHA|nr:histamine H1 receptor [Clupea harengus]